MDRLVKLVRQYQRSRRVTERSRIADELVNAIVPHLHRYIQGRHWHEDVEDVLQETLSDVAETWWDFEGSVDKQFWALCYRIADRKIVDALRGARFDKTVSLDEEDVGRAVEAWIAVESTSTQDRLDVEYAMKLLGNIKPPCRDFLQSRYLLDLGFEEIGRAHGISADAARMAVERCRKLARKLLGE